MAFLRRASVLLRKATRRRAVAATSRQPALGTASRPPLSLVDRPVPSPQQNCFVGSSMSPISMSAPFSPVDGEERYVSASPSAPLFYSCKSCRSRLFDLEHLSHDDEIGKHPGGWPLCSSAITGAVSIRTRQAKELCSPLRPAADDPPDQSSRLGAANRAIRKSLIVADSPACALSTTVTTSPTALRQEMRFVARKALENASTQISRFNYIRNATRSDPVVMEGHCSRCRALVCRVFPRKGHGLVYVIEPRSVKCGP